MSATRYSTVEVAVYHDIAQRWTVPRDERHDFAAERYNHYRANLGNYCGTSVEADGSIVDRFDRGLITVGA